MAIANANFKFIMCDYGTNGRVSDGGVMENTLFYDKLINGTLQLPSTALCRYFAFALRDKFFNPISQKELNRERRVFNYRLSRARQILENAFGIMVARIRIFHSTINSKL